MLPFGSGGRGFPELALWGEGSGDAPGGINSGGRSSRWGHKEGKNRKKIGHLCKKLYKTNLEFVLSKFSKPQNNRKMKANLAVFSSNP